MRTPSRFKIAAAIGATAALVGASLLAATPAYAVQPQVDNYDFSDTGAAGLIWVVPAGVHSVSYTIQGGAGGSSLSLFGGDGGNPATVTGTLLVTPGDQLRLYAGLAGEDAGLTRTLQGDGGDGYNVGGAGATSGVLATPGAGGGGSTAIEQNASLVAHAGGGGGGGGRGEFFLLLETCEGGAGGDAAAAVGNNGFAAFADNPNICNSNQLGGAGGANTLTNGFDATNVPNFVFVNPLLGGSGGGGGGGGAAGTQNLAPIIDNSGGGGGGAGASLGDVISAPDPTLPDGFLSLAYDIAFLTQTTAVVNPNPVAPGQNVTITATVDNIEPGSNVDPLGTVDFGIAGCEAVALIPGVALDGLATASCTYVAGAPSSTIYPVDYVPLLGSIFGPSGTDATVDVVAMLPSTGSSDNAPLLIGGSALLLLLGGAFVAVRRVRAE